MDACLTLEKVCKYFGGLGAVVDLDLAVAPGEVLGLIGPNGAGKTTVLNLVTGFIPCSRGRILFREQDITRARPHVVAQKGIIRTFQQTMLFQGMTALENVLVGCHLGARMSLGALLRGSPRVLSPGPAFPQAEIDRALDILDFVGLSRARDIQAASLPLGHKRVLGIGVALAANPKVILMDEPLIGMNLEEQHRVTSLMRALSERNIAVLLVEHNMRAVMSTCDRIAVLNYGRKIAEGSPHEVRANKEVIQAYLGADVEAVA